VNPLHLRKGLSAFPRDNSGTLLKVDKDSRARMVVQFLAVINVDTS
jgi:hypothetical protein